VDLDAALREWPHAEKPQKDWDERAQSVVDRLLRGERGATSAYVTDEELLAEPLGQSAEDGHNSARTGKSPIHPRAKKGSGTPMTMTADRERDRRSLQDLVKMASGLTPPPPSVGSMPSGVVRAAEAQKDDSGIVDLAAASQADPGAAARAQFTPLASHGLFDDEPAHSQRPPMSGPISAPMSGPLSHPAPVSAPVSAQSLPQQPVPSVPPPPVLTPSAPPVGFGPASMASVHPMPAKKTSSGAIALVVGGLVALSAAAAGTFLYMKSRTTSTTSKPVAMAPAQPATPAAAAAPAEPTPAANAEEVPTPATEPSLDPESLPAVAPPGKDGSKVASAKGVARASKPPQERAAAKNEGPAKLKEKDLAPTPTGPAGDLGAAMKNAVGDEPEKTPAAATTAANVPKGNVPQKPSQGAVTGALGAVLPQARACLGPDDPISRASIVFSSEGTVQSVKVTGGAAGKPAEACIKSALMKAKLQPFAEPTYTANITIRHN
jgi:hypothetical protein